MPNAHERDERSRVRRSIARGAECRHSCEHHHECREQRDVLPERQQCQCVENSAERREKYICRRRNQRGARGRAPGLGVDDGRWPNECREKHEQDHGDRVDFAARHWPVIYFPIAFSRTHEPRNQ